MEQHSDFDDEPVRYLRKPRTTPPVIDRRVLPNGEVEEWERGPTIPDDFIYDPEYLNIHRTTDLVIIQITLSAGRTLEVRKSLFKRMADLLQEEAGIRREDVFINLVETAKENWSFGNGEAQYAT